MSEQNACPPNRRDPRKRHALLDLLLRQPEHRERFPSFGSDLPEAEREGTRRKIGVRPHHRQPVAPVVRPHLFRVQPNPGTTLAGDQEMPETRRTHQFLIRLPLETVRPVLQEPSPRPSVAPRRQFAAKQNVPVAGSRRWLRDDNRLRRQGVEFWSRRLRLVHRYKRHPVRQYFLRNPRRVPEPGSERVGPSELRKSGDHRGFQERCARQQARLHNPELLP